MNFTNYDVATKERKAFINSISPLRKGERLEYAVYWILALVFGTQMPHEWRAA